MKNVAEEAGLRGVAEGLEGIVVTKTKTSLVDGAAGRLVIAGDDVEALARRATFEQATALLWNATGDADAARITSAIGEGRACAFDELEHVRSALSVPLAMDALRGAVAQLPPAFAEHPAWLVGAVGTFAAAHARLASGEAPIAPEPRRGHAADMLAMLGGGEAECAKVRGLDAYLVTVSDHGLNASTFAARVVASTESDLVSAITAAIGALKGPLHGGAPGPVLDMLDAIGTPERAEAWLEAELASGRRIMGMGHRIYRVRDPRAAVLEAATLDLEKAGLRTERLTLARAVEHAAQGALQKRHPNRSLAANVEFYTAVLLDAVGVPRTHFTALFAAARVSGWCAHVAEQRATGRLIRPDSIYVGAMPE